MKKIFICLLVVIAIACNKDKFQSKPQIKIKSTNTDVVPLNETYSVVLEYTDKEGDVNDSIFIVRERLNVKDPLRPPVDNRIIPSFPNTMQGEIQVDLRYADALVVGMSKIPIPGSGGQYEPDTLNVRFVVRDKAGNKSDTAITHVIVIR